MPQKARKIQCITILGEIILNKIYLIKSNYANQKLMNIDELHRGIAQAHKSRGPRKTLCVSELI